MHLNTSPLFLLLSAASGAPLFTGTDAGSTQTPTQFLNDTIIHDTEEVGRVSDYLEKAASNGELFDSKTEGDVVSEYLTQDLLEAIKNGTLQVHTTDTHGINMLQNLFMMASDVKTEGQETDQGSDQAFKSLWARQPAGGGSGGGNGGGKGGSSTKGGGVGIGGISGMDKGEFFTVQCSNVPTDGNTFFTGFDSENEPYKGQLFCTYPAAKRPKPVNNHWFYGKSQGERGGIVIGIMLGGTFVAAGSAYLGYEGWKHLKSKASGSAGSTNQELPYYNGYIGRQ